MEAHLTAQIVYIDKHLEGLGVPSIRNLVSLCIRSVSSATWKWTLATLSFSLFATHPTSSTNNAT